MVLERAGLLFPTVLEYFIYFSISESHYLLLEISFVLVLFLELERTGLAGKNFTSGKLGGLDMSEAWGKTRRRMKVIYVVNPDQRTEQCHSSTIRV